MLCAHTFWHTHTQRKSGRWELRWSGSGTGHISIKCRTYMFRLYLKVNVAVCTWICCCHKETLHFIRYYWQQSEMCILLSKLEIIAYICDDVFFSLLKFRVHLVEIQIRWQMFRIQFLLRKRFFWWIRIAFSNHLTSWSDSDSWRLAKIIGFHEKS
jgi:hypothetical protein